MRGDLSGYEMSRVLVRSRTQSFGCRNTRENEASIEE